MPENYGAWRNIYSTVLQLEWHPIQPFPTHFSTLDKKVDAVDLDGQHHSDVPALDWRVNRRGAVVECDHKERNVRKGKQTLITLFGRKTTYADWKLKNRSKL
jgi:hypothetical protein